MSNIVVMYLKNELMDDIKEQYRLIYGGYKYGKDSCNITIKIGMIGYVLHRAILWDQGVNFLEFERRLKAAEIDYDLGGNYFRYDFKSKDELDKAIPIIYDILFEYKHLKEKGAAVNEYSSEIHTE